MKMKTIKINQFQLAVNKIVKKKLYLKSIEKDLLKLGEVYS